MTPIYDTDRDTVNRWALVPPDLRPEALPAFDRCSCTGSGLRYLARADAWAREHGMEPVLCDADRASADDPQQRMERAA